MKGLAAWWRQPDHFDWLTGYLQSQGSSRNARRLFAGLAGSLALYPADVLFGPAPFWPAELVASVLIAGVGLGVAAVWLSRWPTRRQSVAFTAAGSLCIATGSLLQQNPFVALLAGSAMAIPGGYFAFFHTAKYMAANFLLAGAVGAVEVARLVADGQAMLGVNGYCLLLELNVVAPFAIQAVVRALGLDLLRTDRDPLTGLLNRRACDRAIVGRILASGDHSYLAVAMLDLDRFKDLNDSRGHAAGDEALVAVARALTAVCNETALIGRVGGEEFLVADIVRTPQPPDWSRLLCEAVAKAASPVTASVGTATLALGTVGSDGAERAYRLLVADADTAMYEAKRHGGNHVRHHVRLAGEDQDRSALS